MFFRKAAVGIGDAVDAAVYRYIAAFQVQSADMQSVSLQEQKTTERFHHHALLVEGRYLKHTADADMLPLLHMQCMYVPFFFRHKAHPLQQGYAAQRRNIPLEGFFRDAVPNPARGCEYRQEEGGGVSRLPEGKMLDKSPLQGSEGNALKREICTYRQRPLSSWTPSAPVPLSSSCCSRTESR